MNELSTKTQTSTMKTIGLAFASGFVGAGAAMVLCLALVLIFWAPLQSLLGPMLPFTTSQSVTQQVANQTPETFADSDTIVQTVDTVQPAVVSIVISKDVPILEEYYAEEDPFGFFNSPFTFRVPQYRENGTEKQEIGGGSGFLVSADGLIVTNKHVAEDESAEYTVFMNDGSEHKATVLARDPVNDIAVLKIEGENFPYLEFGNSDEIKPGQTAIAIGNALSEFDNSVSVGVISGLGRSIVAGDGMGRAEQLDNVIQTDAAINPGNSGGPLLNTQGQVIGVNVAVASGSENIGFALTSNLVKKVVDSVKENGRIVRPYIGVRYIDITPEFAEELDLPVESGALVQRGEQPTELAVLPGSPADKAGIEENDIITQVNGNAITPENRLVNELGKYAVGETITMRVWHDGEEKDVEVTLEEYTANQGE